MIRGEHYFRETTEKLLLIYAQNYGWSVQRSDSNYEILDAMTGYSLAMFDFNLPLTGIITLQMKYPKNPSETETKEVTDINVNDQDWEENLELGVAEITEWLSQLTPANKDTE
jgi:hypothetical protein